MIRNTYIVGMLFAFLGFTGFAVGDAGFKWLTQYHAFSNIVFPAAMLTFTFMLLYSPFQGGLKAFKSTAPKLQLIRGTIVTAQFLCSIYAIKFLPLPIFYTIAFIAPSFAAILGALILKESVSKKNCFAIALGLTGVFIALKPWTVLNGEFVFYPLAVLILLLASFLLASSQIMARIIGKTSTDSGYITALFPTGLAFIACGFLFFLNEPRNPAEYLSAIDMLIIVIIALGGIAGNVLLALAFKLAPAALASPFHYTQIIWALLFGTLLFNDQIDPFMIAGSSLVIASGLYLVTNKTHSQKQIENDPNITQI